MGWFAWLVMLLIVAIICFGVYLFLSICDMTLLWNLKYGKSPDCLAGKVVWIWGATLGTGEALAVELAKRGCKLILSGTRGKMLNETKAKCLESGKIRQEDILCHLINIYDPTSHQDAVDRVVERFKQVDIVVNDVRGVFRFKPEWAKRPNKINLFEPVSLTKAVLPYMPSDGQYVLAETVTGKASMFNDGLRYDTLLKRDMDTCFDSSKTKGRPENVSLTIICSESVSGDNPSWGRRRRQILPERITQLATVAIANRLFEAWIVTHPVLAYFYLFHYLPSIGKRIEKWL